MPRERAREFRVGVFVAVLLAAIGVSVFVVSGSTDLLESRYTLYGAWEDVAGLKEGAVVRLAGWDVGEVTAIRFSDDLGVKQLFVEMKILGRYKERIRADSEARIDTVGVLGDKYVAISMGDPSQPVLEDGDWIRTRPALDVLEYTKKVTDILNSTSSIARKLDLMLGEQEEARSAGASLARSVEHLESILAAAREGDGLLHALVYDEGLTRQVSDTVANLHAMSEDLRATTGAIREGDGLAHEVVFGESGAALARDLREVADALAGLTRDIKSEDSVVHALIYDPDAARLVEDLAETARSLRETAEAIERGEGTVGLLARDPALYEDLRALVRGAQRNKLLRAYIRRTVRRAERTEAAPWTPAGDGG